MGFDGIFDNEANFGRGEIIIVVVHLHVVIIVIATATADFDERMRNIKSDGFGARISGNAKKRELDLNVGVAFEEVFGGGFGCFVVFEEGVDGAVEEGGVYGTHGSGSGSGSGSGGGWCC